MPSDAPAKPSRAGALAAIIAAAVLISAPIASQFEGLRTQPYHDPGDGRLTVCYGETEREMRQYTAEECQVLLEARQQADYAPAVLKCVPGLVDRINAFAASVDFAYNEGVAAFCGSSMAKLFNAGQWAEGCDRFLAWNGVISAQPLKGAVSVRRLRDGRYFNVFRGLQRRREAERQLCLKD